MFTQKGALGLEIRAVCSKQGSFVELIVLYVSKNTDLTVSKNEKKDENFTRKKIGR